LAAGARRTTIGRRAPAREAPLPIEPIIDPTRYDAAAIAISIDEVRAINRHRGSFEQLDGLLELDLERKLAVGVRHVRPDAFWVADHFPGQPILPGVLMIESLAQLCSYYFHRAITDGAGRTMGFGGLEGVSFRGAVLPGQTMILAARNCELRPRRAQFHCQGFVSGKCVVEATVIGMPIMDKAWNAATV